MSAQRPKTGRTGARPCTHANAPGCLSLTIGESVLEAVSAVEQPSDGGHLAVSRRRFLPVLGAAVGLAGFLAAPSTGTRQQRGPELSEVRVMARIGDDTVLSTGYVVDAEQGRVLTTAHSLWGATSLKMQTGLAVVHARVLARDPCDDI